MIILNTGVPRSGTVLVNAIIRELLRGLAPTVLQANPHGTELLRLLRQAEEGGQMLYNTLLVHTHTWNADVTQWYRGREDHVRVVMNYRDPRDVCVSLMRLHENDFDQTCKAVLVYYEQMAACVAATDALVLPYELLVQDARPAIFQIGRHLGLWPRLDRVAEIAEATSMDRHRKVMEELQAGKRAKVNQRQNRNRVLVEDRETLINDRHIQSGVSGRWKSELTEDQQSVATERFAKILTRFGYEAA